MSLLTAPQTRAIGVVVPLRRQSLTNLVALGAVETLGESQSCWTSQEMMMLSLVGGVMRPLKNLLKKLGGMTDHMMHGYLRQVW